MKNLLAKVFGNSGILEKPGDSFIAKKTDTGRDVIIVDKGEKGKYSATRYPSGTIVETKTTYPKK